jgi:hypothetical protein
MPYLQPEVILGRFAQFTRSNIRSGIKEDEEFLKSQAGSMSSTLRFLAREIEHREDSVAKQREVLLDALEDVRSATEAERVQRAADDARTQVENANAMDVYDVEKEFLDACNEVLTVIDETLGEGDANPTRAPLYEFIEFRLDEQLRILGRDEE